jgi:hypothetical protein
MELHGKDQLKRKVIDGSDAGRQEEAFAVIEVEGLSQAVVVQTLAATSSEVASGPRFFREAHRADGRTFCRLNRRARRGSQVLIMDY